MRDQFLRHGQVGEILVKAHACRPAVSVRLNAVDAQAAGVDVFRYRLYQRGVDGQRQGVVLWRLYGRRILLVAYGVASA